ncbi:MAG: TetR/AcrR family transcriptional regulator [Pantoea sp.]|uniref:TetR/AcrR family transcriptional regulator n=1 Tax=Pantoea piersonii TaxID=2364647 RepID=UPI000EE47A96|nr:TetR/AcrR family transcriptional regulator [Pantoea piersonii]MDU6433137.1 TetR/AcrR family transcriptional regulator [Pantoea sp.]HCW98403.1 TetR family transcriptional regulator [Pantoea sp.]
MDKLSHKARTRQRILDEAARVMRECGTESIGVASLMKRVGLTHGGFYAHFDSREALVQAVIAEMFTDSTQRMQPLWQQPDPAERLNTLIDYYLSETHRDSPAEGCPMPALVSEVGHLPDEAKAIFTQGVASMLKRLSELLTELGLRDAEALASSLLAEMVGALALARACPDKALSATMLARSRQALKRRTELERAA